MNAIVVEESETQRAIVTPDLRLRFLWTGDRWTHAIDIRPGPWQTAVEAVEQAGDEVGLIVSPAYQQLDLMRDGDDVLALAVGKAGPHHFSASFRVSYRSWRANHFAADRILQDRSESRVIVDLADRCRCESESVEAQYKICAPPIDLHLGESSDREAPGGFSRKWRSGLVWEARVEDNYHVALSTACEQHDSQASIVDRDAEGNWFVRVAPRGTIERGTVRFCYSWAHERVHAFEWLSDRNDTAPWSLPGSVPPDTLLP